MSARPIERIIGIYDADGGLVGEARYVLGKLLGSAHCALCDVTHSPVRRKASWDRMVRQLGIPVTLLHRNEIPDSLAAITGSHGLPLVIGLAGSRGEVLLTAADLAGVAGSVEAFDDRLGRVLARRGQSVPRPRAGVFAPSPEPVRGPDSMQPGHPYPGEHQQIQLP